MTQIKVNWFIPVKHKNYNNMPASIWIRCLQLIPYLKKLNIACTINDLTTEADISVFVRWQNDKAYSLIEKSIAKGQKVIFDLCVNYLEPAGQIGKSYGSFPEQRKQALRMMEASDAVTCASDFIRQRASKFHPNAAYIPDSIDQGHFKFKKDHRDFFRESLTLVYAGVASKADFLFKNIYPLIKKKGMKLMVLSDKRPRIWARYHYKKWRYEQFPQDILEGEIGIAPRRTDNPYDKGHSIYKIGVFLAQSIPVLASSVPSYNELLDKGAAGKVCDSLSSWDEALNLVANNREILIKWSQEAYEIIKPYRSETIANRYIQLFRKLLI